MAQIVTRNGRNGGKGNGRTTHLHSEGGLGMAGPAHGLGGGSAAPDSASNHLQVPGGVSARMGGRTTPNTPLAGLKPWDGSATQQRTFSF
jgi:hypothetical protein